MRGERSAPPRAPSAHNGGSFSCTTSDDPGWARIEGRHLRFVESNKVTFAVGHNNGWQDDVEQPSFANMERT